jgi:hypothetical protein
MLDKANEDLVALEEIMECLGMALFETIRCAVVATDSKALRTKSDTGNMREAWCNLANKIAAFAEDTP